MKLSKLTTAQLEKKIGEGKIPADQLDDANTLLLKRKGEIKVTKIKEEPKLAAKKKAVKKAVEEQEGENNPFLGLEEEKKKPVKKEKAAPKAKKEKVEKAPPTEKLPATIADYETSDKTVSGLVKKMLMPTEGSTVAGCTYGQANKAVQKKFGRKLHTSEFQRNFDILKELGLLTEKLPPRYQTEEEKAQKEKVDKKKGGDKEAV